MIREREKEVFFLCPLFIFIFICYFDSTHTTAIQSIDRFSLYFLRVSFMWRAGMMKKEREKRISHRSGETKSTKLNKSGIYMYTRRIQSQIENK